jgi:hypothetical protein
MVAAVGTDASQAQVIAVVELNTAGIRASQIQVNAVTDGTNKIDVSQTVVNAVVRGRIGNKKARCWTASLDGHDFYILRLGDASTIVWDDTAQQWYVWDNDDNPFLRQHQGLNWVGMGNNTGVLQTNVVAGDDNFGLLWLAEPLRGYDDDPREAYPLVEFQRQVTGGIPLRLREASPVGAVYLTASLGNPSVAAPTIRLRTSDDSGKTWIDQGSITVTSEDFSQEFSWRSLGLIKAPGRIFEITDNGGSVRIDGLDMR